MLAQCLTFSIDAIVVNLREIKAVKVKQNYICIFLLYKKYRIYTNYVYARAAFMADLGAVLGPDPGRGFGRKTTL